ncbi:hypothetical protein EG829_03390 [bacterium]|nr:hypothetical protein [bacterium]
MTFGPYIILAVIAVTLLVIMRLQARAAGTAAARLEARMSELERKLAGVEGAYRDEIRRAGEEKDLKISQLRDDLRTTLDSFVEATGNKLAENAAIQKSRFDQLSERIAVLARQEARKPEPRPEPKPEPPVQTSAPRQSPAHEKAKRLARLIVSDIVLYNQAAVEEGVRNNTFSELLAHDIQEARTLYAQRVSEEVRNSTSYLEEAFSDLIARKKRDMNIA